MVGIWTAPPLVKEFAASRLAALWLHGGLIDNKSRWLERELTSQSAADCETAEVSTEGGAVQIDPDYLLPACFAVV